MTTNATTDNRRNFICTDDTNPQGAIVCAYGYREAAEMYCLDGDWSATPHTHHAVNVTLEGSIHGAQRVAVQIHTIAEVRIIDTQCVPEYRRGMVLDHRVESVDEDEDSTTYHYEDGSCVVVDKFGRMTAE